MPGRADGTRGRGRPEVESGRPVMRDFRPGIRPQYPENVLSAINITNEEEETATVMAG